MEPNSCASSVTRLVYLLRLLIWIKFEIDLSRSRRIPNFRGSLFELKLKFIWAEAEKCWIVEASCFDLKLKFILVEAGKRWTVEASCLIWSWNLFGSRQGDVELSRLLDLMLLTSIIVLMIWQSKRTSSNTHTTITLNSQWWPWCCIRSLTKLVHGRHSVTWDVCKKNRLIIWRPQPLISQMTLFYN